MESIHEPVKIHKGTYDTKEFLTGDREDEDKIDTPSQPVKQLTKTDTLTRPQNQRKGRKREKPKQSEKSESKNVFDQNYKDDEYEFDNENYE